MKAVTYRRFGGTNVLEWTDTENPQPKPGEIGVRVRASSINPFECDIREGTRFVLVRYGQPGAPIYDFYATDDGFHPAGIEGLGDREE